MSTSPDDQPTKVLPQAAPEQPSAVAAPATRRSPTWHQRVPSHIGRARTSTVVLGGLFVVLFVLNLFLPSQDSGTTPVTLPNGQTVDVPNSALPSDVPTGTPTPTEPETPVPVVPTSPVPPDDGEDEEPVGTPSRTTTPRAPTPTPTPTRTPSPTSETTEQEEETTDSEPTGTTAVETTADPTG
ncbi:hypothetical protein IN07_11550 [Modestobacter caceresii]|uniref:Uncharacterized protein n=1 Tax=Modestobacter caceresii TaxID=1522368 RepID=A0A098Y864_9ACTN|nr:hypothetical protein [Modestobacter caceresii]KGH46630.1 hypothetical protein IN07_11550 [Modestobacter caceresii]